ncbi:hypothetical protein ACFP2T_27215 [Plantactinospora solaniradicis]|uniref:Lipoprotein n=1 Tax=Plantactinospora solaniradicis TaxID=1723736 RepID=A0ABW1KGA2_9ACTN
MSRHGAPSSLTTTLVLAVSAALVAGCGDASGHARPDVPLPFGGAVHVPAMDRRLLTAAEEELVATCMTRRGMPYLPERSGPDAGVPEDGAAIYSLIEPREARLHGYGMGERLLHTSSAPGASADATTGQGAPAAPPGANDVAPAAPPGANDVARAAMTDERRRAWDVALLGTPGREVQIEVEGTVFTYRPDGCVTLARQELFGEDWDRLQLTAQVAVNTVTQRVWRALAVTAAVERWSDCMTGKGRDFASPAEPRGTIDQALSRVAPGDRAAFSAALRLEHETATADADCQRDSGLWEAVTTAQRAAEGATPPAAATAVTSLRAARERALVAAHRIVGTSATPGPGHSAPDRVTAPGTRHHLQPSSAR